MKRPPRRRPIPEAVREHLARRPGPAEFFDQGLSGLDAYEEALDLWRTELARLEATARRGPARRKVG